MTLSLSSWSLNPKHQVRCLIWIQLTFSVQTPMKKKKGFTEPQFEQSYQDSVSQRDLVGTIDFERAPWLSHFLGIHEPNPLQSA